MLKELLENIRPIGVLLNSRIGLAVIVAVMLHYEVTAMLGQVQHMHTEVLTVMRENSGQHVAEKIQQDILAICARCFK